MTKKSKLFDAIRNGDLESVKRIISLDQNMLDLAISDSGKKALGIALWSEKTRVIEYLLTYQTCQHQMIDLIFKEHKRQMDWYDILIYIEML